MKHQSFDLVFLDMNMPVLDGVGAAKAMRRFNTKTPIVALTANQYPEERSACLLAGMNDILVKPIDIKALQDALVKWIPEE
jgi:two-component system sensor histidine kinase/response regulator